MIIDSGYNYSVYIGVKNDEEDEARYRKLTNFETQAYLCFCLSVLWRTTTIKQSDAEQILADEHCDILTKDLLLKDLAKLEGHGSGENQPEESLGD